MWVCACASVWWWGGACGSVWVGVCVGACGSGCPTVCGGAVCVGGRVGQCVCVGGGCGLWCPAVLVDFPLARMQARTHTHIAITCMPTGDMNTRECTVNPPPHTHTQSHTHLEGVGYMCGHGVNLARQAKVRNLQHAQQGHEEGGSSGHGVELREGGSSTTYRRWQQHHI